MKEELMQKNKSAVVARRAWHFLRLALLWARKGGFLKNTRLMLAHLRFSPKHLIRALRNSSCHQRGPGALGFGDRELSFDDTPVLHLNMHRPSSSRFLKIMPRIPCIDPDQVLDFDYDFGPDDDQDILSRKSFLKAAASPHDDDDSDCDSDDEKEEHANRYDFQHFEFSEQINSPSPSDCEEGIDLKAERFIAKFYEQIRLQRQIS